MVSFSRAAAAVFSSAFLVVSSAAAGATRTTTPGEFTPIRIHYEDLLRGRISLLDALEDSSGIVSLTNLPDGFSSIKKEVLSGLHFCIADQQQRQQTRDDDAVFVVAEETYADGTVRRTLATATTASEGPLDLKLLDSSGSTSASACHAFETNLDRFRSLANAATDAFAEALSRELEPHLEKPLLVKKKKIGDNDDNDSSSYDTIHDLVAHGEQLEHFHSYQKTKGIGEVYYDDDSDDHETAMATIDVHADQGFFIAFTPGMMISSKPSENDDDNAVSSSGGFFIVEEGDDDDDSNLPVHVAFDVDTDDLVFMLGDGVNQ